jgi:hypothetical protein
MRRHLLATLVVLALIAAACSGGDDADSTTTSAETSSTAPSTTAAATTTQPSTTATSRPTTTTTRATTTTEGGPASPLNGIPDAEDEDLLDRRVMAVKIDNHPQARPQSGLLEADAVVEILVEGGFTRFLALFHDNDSTYLGPVRSARPTDAGILRPLGATFAFSGAQNWVINYLLAREIPVMGEGVEGMFRIGGRVAPHNLYADTNGLRNAADGRGYDDEFGNPLYEVAPWDELPSATADSITFSWDPYNTVTWEYDAADGLYYRSIDGREHTWISGQDGVEEQVAVPVLVVLVGRRYTASPPGNAPGSALPATETIGSGELLVFTEGTVLEGTWEREGIASTFLLRDAAGNPVSVPPGQPWISVFPDNRTIDWS